MGQFDALENGIETPVKRWCTILDPVELDARVASEEAIAEAAEKSPKFEMEFLWISQNGLKKMKDGLKEEKGKTLWANAEYRERFARKITGMKGLTPHNLARLSDYFMERLPLLIEHLPAEIDYSHDTVVWMLGKLQEEVLEILLRMAADREKFVEAALALEKKDSGPSSGTASQDSLPRNVSDTQAAA